VGQRIVDSVSPWILGPAVVAFAVAFAVVGLRLTRGRVAPIVKDGHNEVAGYLFAAVGVAYTVVLAFVVVSVHDQYEEANSAATKESAVLVSLYRDSMALPEPSQPGIQAAIRTYIDEVERNEWPALARGERSEPARDAFDRLERTFRDVEPQTTKQQIVFAESLRRLNDVSDLRSARTIQSSSGLPGLLYFVLLVDAVLLVGFSFFFRMDHGGVQMVLTSILAVFIALLLFLVLRARLSVLGLDRHQPRCSTGRASRSTACPSSRAETRAGPLVSYDAGHGTPGRGPVMDQPEVRVSVAGYRDLVRVGSGGFSMVYRAYQEAFDRTVAVKVLTVELVDETAQRRFQRECRASGRLSNHPNIVTVLDSGFTDDGRPYITTEFMTHGALSDRLEAQGPYPVAEVLEIGVLMCSALAAVHAAGILHRDIKPQEHPHLRLRRARFRGLRHLRHHRRTRGQHRHLVHHPAPVPARCSRPAHLAGLGRVLARLDAVHAAGGSGPVPAGRRRRAAAADAPRGDGPHARHRARGPRSGDQRPAALLDGEAALRPLHHGDRVRRGHPGHPGPPRAPGHATAQAGVGHR
jgi:hypothetical protein